MNANTHLVARQTIEVIASRTAETAPLVERTSAAYDRLAAVIERSLDTIDMSGQRLRIDRVELDLGPCDPARWEDALAEGISKCLAPKIIEAVNRGGHARADTATAALHMLEEFSCSGRLPWWCNAADTPESAIDTPELAELHAEAVRALLSLPAAVDRFVKQLDEHHLLRLLHLARPDLLPESVAAWLSTASLAQPGVPPIVARSERARFWRAILAEAATTGPVRSTVAARHSEQPWPIPSAKVRPSGGAVDAEVERFLAAAARRSGIHVTGSGTRLVEGASTNSTLNPVAVVSPASRHTAMPAEALASALSVRIRALSLNGFPATELLAQLASVTGQLDATSIAAANAAIESDSSLAGVLKILGIFADAGCIGSDDAIRWREAIASKLAQAGEKAHDAVAVITSGLPLLWPFLPSYLASLGMFDGEQFRDVAAQHRAATLFHHIATGEIACPEHELTLAKVLAGIDPDAVHDPGEPLDRPELDSVESLLADVLGHAPMLGRISIAGLREAFLNRPGLLSTRDGHWLLRVERRGFDILLDRLPWSFAWVRLPWMASPMQVEW